MGAGAAGRAMDGPRPLLLLLPLLLGVSASRRGARALSPDGNPNGLRFRQGKTEQSEGVPDAGGGWRAGSSDARIHGGASRVLRAQRRP